MVLLVFAGWQRKVSVPKCLGQDSGPDTVLFPAGSEHGLLRCLQGAARKVVVSQRSAQGSRGCSGSCGRGGGCCWGATAASWEPRLGRERSELIPAPSSLALNHHSGRRSHWQHRAALPGMGSFQSFQKTGSDVSSDL